MGHIPRYSMVFIKALKTPLLIFFAVTGNLLLIVCASLFYKLENGINPSVESFFDAIWWAFCTVSTVGFGDIVPVTNMGRAVGIFLMVTGVTFFVGFTAILVSVISSLVAKEIVRGEEMTYQEYRHVMDELRKIDSRLGGIERSINPPK